MPTQRYLIIGFGVYGISIALHLEHPAQLTILSYHQPHEPSNDISKIVRIDYENVLRMEEAIYAQQFWTNDGRFKPFYRPVGRIVAYDETAIPTLNGIDSARTQFGKKRRNRSDKAMLEKAYGSTNALDDLTFVFNEDDGLVEWDGCIRAMKEEIGKRCRENKGSKILDVRAEKLIHEGRRITAVVLAGGEIIEIGDTNVILAAGPWIAELLEKSGIEQPPESRAPTATGLFAFTLQLSEDQIKLFKGRPSFSHIGHAEFLPPTKDDGIAKITYISPFTNVQSGSPLSYPKDVSDSFLALQAMLEVKRWAQKYLPELRGAKFTGIRSYWDGMTQTQDPLISRHPQYDNFVVAGAGCYNRAKDLPSLGETVVKVIKGEPINPYYGWNPDTKPLHHDQPLLLSRGNFIDLEREAERSPAIENWISGRRSQTKIGYLDEI